MSPPFSSPFLDISYFDDKILGPSIWHLCSPVLKLVDKSLYFLYNFILEGKTSEGVMGTNKTRPLWEELAFWL